MRKYSKKQLNAISYAKTAAKRKREQEFLEDVGMFEEFQAQTTYKTMQGFINHITGGKYYEVMR